MAINITWDNEEQTILRWEFPSVWTWDEFEQAARILNSVEYPVDVVILSGGGRFPGGNAFAQLARTLNPRNQRFNRMVIVGNNDFENKLVAIMVKLYRAWSDKVRRVHSLAEAQDVLAHSGEAKQLHQSPAKTMKNRML